MTGLASVRPAAVRASHAIRVLLESSLQSGCGWKKCCRSSIVPCGVGNDQLGNGEVDMNLLAQGIREASSEAFELQLKAVNTTIRGESQGY